MGEEKLKPCRICGAECRMTEDVPGYVVCVEVDSSPPGCAYDIIPLAVHNALPRAADCAAEEWTPGEPPDTDTLYLVDYVWVDLLGISGRMQGSTTGSHWHSQRREKNAGPTEVSHAKLNLPEDKG